MHASHTSPKFPTNSNVPLVKQGSIPPSSLHPNLRTSYAVKIPQNRLKKKKRESISTNALALNSPSTSDRLAAHMKNDGKNMGEPLRKRNGNIQAFRSTTRNAMKNSTCGTSQWCTTCKTRTSAVLATTRDYVRRWKSATINAAQEEA